MENSKLESQGTENVPWWTSCRFMLSIIGFFGFIMVYALRADMSVAIVCMVNHTMVELAPTKASNNSGYSDSDCRLQLNTLEDGEFLWSKPTQGLILGSFFWGYLITQVPGGWIATRYGGKRVFGWSIFVATVATLLTPLASRVHYVFLIIIRIIIGFGSSVAFPSMHALWGKWAPPLERSRLTAISYAGAQMGNVVTFPLASVLCRYGFAGGWPSVFYIIGGISLIWFIAWMFLVSDSPSTHPRISDKEKYYILNSLKQGSSDHKARSVPWCKLITSMPVWAIIVANVFSDWGAYNMMTGIPSYMKDVLQFDITSNGFYSALPYILFWLVIIISGWLADFLQSRGLLSTTRTRKVLQAFGQIIPAVMLIGLGFLNCHQSVLAVLMLTLGVAFTGTIFSGFIVNIVDIAPVYAGVVFAISNSLGSVTGFVAPVVTGVLTVDKTQDQWRIVFFITAVIYVAGAVFYIIFASGDVQIWARTDAYLDDPLTYVDERGDRNHVAVDGNIESEKINLNEV